MSVEARFETGSWCDGVLKYLPDSQIFEIRHICDKSKKNILVSSLNMENRGEFKDNHFSTVEDFSTTRRHVFLELRRTYVHPRVSQEC